MTSEKEENMRKAIHGLNQVIEDQTKHSIGCVQNANALEFYRLVFNFLNEQKWYQDNHHKVKKYLDSVVYGDK